MSYPHVKWPHEGPTRVYVEENTIWFIQFFAVHYEASIDCMKFYNMLLKNQNFRERFKEIEKVKKSDNDWMGFGLEIPNNDLFIVAKFMLSEYMMRKNIEQIDYWPGQV